MAKSPKIFRLSSLRAGACLLAIVLLMLVSPFLVLTFFICVVYAVVPVSLWRKHRTLRWRGSILITCLLGFGLIASGLVLEVVDSRLAHEYDVYPAGFVSPIIAFSAGVVFLPLACIGSIHSFVVAVRSKRSLSRQNRID